MELRIVTHLAIKCLAVLYFRVGIDIYKKISFRVYLFNYLLFILSNFFFLLVCTYAPFMF